MIEDRLIDLEIDEACRLKWQRGQKVYGQTFVGHPLIQLDEELIDALNYLEEAARWGYDIGDIPQQLRAIRERTRAQFRTMRPVWGSAMADADSACERYLVENATRAED